MKVKTLIELFEPSEQVNEIELYHYSDQWGWIKVDIEHPYNKNARVANFRIEESILCVHTKNGVIDN